MTAADATGARASFAGRGSQISLAAYGDTGPGGAPGIFSTYPSNSTQIESGDTNPPSPPCPSCRTTLNGDPRYGYLSGTSMAAPQVVGAVALVRAADPHLSNLSVIRLMKKTAIRTRGWTNDLGWGIVDAGAAVRGALALAADTVPPRASPRGGRKRQSGKHFKIRWRGRDKAGPGIAAAGIGLPACMRAGGTAATAPWSRPAATGPLHRQAGEQILVLHPGSRPCRKHRAGAAGGGFRDPRPENMSRGDRPFAVAVPCAATADSNLHA